MRISLTGSPGRTRLIRPDAGRHSPWLDATATSDEAEEVERLDTDIEEISSVADLDLCQAEELRDNSDRVLRGYIRALKRRYSSPAFGKAIEE